MTPEIAMELRNVSKTIGNKEIIKNVSFQIHKGEVFGLIGPNGAGKTTTIRLMVGLMELTEGDIYIYEKSIQKEFKEAIREIGAIVENPEMYPFMTGWQNLKHYARMIPGITDDKIRELIAFVGLEKPIHEKVGKYSLGMRQRLGIVQALLHDPSVLILDEPTNGLDPSGIREVRQYIRQLATEKNVSVIVSSHLLSEIELMCDRIGIIKNGELITTQWVHDEKAEEKNLRQIEITVDPTDRAIELLHAEYAIEAISDRGIVRFQAEKEQVPEIIRTFVKHDLAIYNVHVTQGTLEDRFFDWIGENVIE